MPEQTKSTSTENFPVQDLNRVIQSPELARYDRKTIFGILDCGVIAHVSFLNQSRPMVVPMIYGRDVDRLFLHASPASRFVASIAGETICIAVTLVDGLVVGRSIFESSLNYRSVVVHGRARELGPQEEKLHALWVISEHYFPGRWDEVRRPHDEELQATTTLEIRIEAASAKTRNGPPIDAYNTYDPQIWAGVVPMTAAIGEPVADSKTAPNVPLPPSLSRFRAG